MKNKVRIAPKATKGRGNRWRKGESSNCNASNKKFRQRVNLMGPLTNNSSGVNDFETLRLESLELNSLPLVSGEENMETKSVSMDVDQESIGSCNTFASIYTNCTNMSFSKLMEKWTPSSLLHREMIAILATVTETIKENGGSESETEYFAILVVMLETAEKEETLAAIACLLSMVIRKLPDTVKKLKFDLSEMFSSKIVAHRDKTNGYLVVSLMRCLSELMKSQEAIVLRTTKTLEVYEVLLSLTLDPKPKIRKTAHRTIVSILKATKVFYENAEHHVLAPKTVEFCVSTIEDNKVKSKDGSKDNINDALHMLNLLKDIIDIVPTKSLENCCKTVLRAMFLANPLIINGVFSVFLQLFSSSSPLRTLTSKLNVKLLNFLQEHRPSYTDSQLLHIWTSVIKEGLISLYKLEKAECLKMIPSSLSSMLPCFESESNVHLMVTSAIQQIIQTIISPSLMDLNHQIRAAICVTFESCFQFKYQNAWKSICYIIGTLFEHIGPQAPDLISNFIKKLIDLREGYNNELKNAIELAISKAIKFLGPKVILDAVPLIKAIMNENNQFSHSWLLPLLRDNIEKAELKLFKEYFLILSHKIETKMQTLRKVGQASDKSASLIKEYSTLHKQVWSLLPSFCRQPTDIKKEFDKDFATLLRDKIRSQVDLRSYCLASLRNLISSSTSDEDKMVLKLRAKGYIQDFITIYINPEISGFGRKDIQPVYETLRVYLTITDDRVRDKSMEFVLEKLRNLDEQSGLEKMETETKDEDDSENISLRNHLLDILLLYVPYFSAEKLKAIYDEIIFPVIKEGHITKKHQVKQMKKIYQIFNEICCNPNCKEFFSALLYNLATLLKELFNRCPDQVKYLPINTIDILCSKEIVKPEKEHIPDILKLIIECIETGKVKCKKSGFALLNNLPAYINNNSTFVQQCLINLISLNDENLTPGQVLVLGHGILDLNQEELTNEAQSKLFSLFGLLRSEKRALIKAVFQIVNLWLKKTSKDELYRYVYNIVISMNSLSSDYQKAFRHEVKVILIKLIRKFGYEMMSKLAPESYVKVLRNIRKSEAQKMRKRNAEDDDILGETLSTSASHKSTRSMEDILRGEDSDSDELPDDESQDDKRSQATSRSRKKRSKTYIEEGDDDDDILDLMAPNIISKIHSSNPIKSKPSKAAKKDEFRINEDGKIVFDFKEMEKGNKRKRQDEDDDDEPGESDDDSDERGTKTIASTRSKQSKVSKTSKSSKVSQGTRASYKPGGKGIHRHVKKRKTGIKGAKTGEEFAGKKGGGDITKMGGPDPYAYVPLNGALLNRRKKNKFKGYFNKLIQHKSKSSKRKTD